MKKVLLSAFAFSMTCTAVSAETLIHPDGGWTFETVQACNAGYYTYNGKRYDVGRYKGKLVIGEEIFDVKCGFQNSGGSVGSSGGGETLGESQARSGETSPGETSGGESQQGETDSGEDAGFGAISG